MQLSLNGKKNHRDIYLTPVACDAEVISRATSTLDVSFHHDQVCREGVSSSTATEQSYRLETLTDFV